ncbi:MAG: DUF4349 domain-containing protein [Chloroflexi bacterium]|nr:DUF4349 domain-containing protein [Chloroflexota bacterium]
MSARVVALLGLIVVLATSACGAASTPSSGAPPRPAAESAARPAAAPRQAATAGGAQAQADTANQTLPSTDRMIIRTVSMTIAVGNVQDVQRAVERLAGEHNGYVQGSQVRQDGDRTMATVTLRVPADQATYEITLEQLRSLADRVVEEQSQAQDITEEYIDLNSRLRNLRASEESLLALLGKAQKVDDILAIQRELTNVRGQIEQIQGRKQALERRSDMATITVTIRETGAFARGGWNPGATFEEAVRSLGQALRGIAAMLIWLAVFSPVWGGFLVVLWLFVRLVRWLWRGRRPRTPRVVPPVPATSAPTA